MEEPLKERLKKRLNELKTELERGQKSLADLETQRTNITETLLRISGAIQVISEELSKEEQTTDVKEK